MFATLSKKRVELQLRFVSDLGDFAEVLSSKDMWPLQIRVKSIGLILAVYLFPNTNPHGGRAFEEYKFNLKVPGQKQNERSNFDYSLGDPLLVSYAEDYDVYVIYEAKMHHDFLWSSNIQSRVELLRSASINGFATATKKNGERLIGVTSSKLTKGIIEHLKLLP